MDYELWLPLVKSVLCAVGALVIASVLASAAKDRLDAQKIYNENIRWLDNIIYDLKQERESLRNARKKFQQEKKEWEIQLEKKVFPDMLVNGDLNGEIEAIKEKFKVIEGGYNG